MTKKKAKQEGTAVVGEIEGSAKKKQKQKARAKTPPKASRTIFENQGMTAYRVLLDTRDLGDDEKGLIIRVYLKMPLDGEQQDKLKLRRIIEDPKLDHKKTITLKPDEFNLGVDFTFKMAGIVIGDSTKRTIINTSSANLTSATLKGSEITLAVVVPVVDDDLNNSGIVEIKKHFLGQIVDVTIIQGAGQEKMFTEDDE